jgi:replicative DNA helicase
MSQQIDSLAPHNVEAEEAVLGAILLSPEALFEVLPFINTDDFFIVRHAWIWETIVSLHERRAPIDYLTVASDLEQMGRLDEIGGAAYLLNLISKTPSALNIEGYGRVVEQMAVRRRLISAASRIAQVAHSEEPDIDEVINRAEQAIFEVTERRLSRELVPIRDVVSDYFDHVSYLTRHQGEFIGVPTGFKDLDLKLGYLQKSDLIIVASRPGMGKSSLLASMVMNAARYHQRVALFSLEMSNEQIVQRFISMDTGIPSNKLREGKLDDRDWDRFVKATQSLSELPIHMDDTPSLSTQELRTKARRLHMEFGLNLILIDYLQLMTTPFRTENRVQEISFISRALKGLARELNVPVVAAAQLSRAVEQRTDKRPQLADLRESGCLAGDTRIYLPDSGSYTPIRELAGREEFRVLGLNPETFGLNGAVVSNAFCTGTKPVYRLTTQLGRSVRATGNHKFLTVDGWRRLDELVPGEHIALPLLTPCSTPSRASRFPLSIVMERGIKGVRTKKRRSISTTLFPQATSGDVYWDKVVSIEPDGVSDVYDLTVPGLHNFVADDIIVHNSIEQDADVVTFIYRDAYYNPDTPVGNRTEVNVAKHRNGPTGLVNMVFIPEITQFKDAAPQHFDLDAVPPPEIDEGF